MNTHNDLLPDGDDHEPQNPDLLAGEFVLGVLDAQARQQAQARIEAEPAFARLVAGWEQRFAGWLDEIEAVPAPAPAHAQAWPRVRTALGWSPVDGARRNLWQNINVWRGATAAAFAAAAALAVVFLVSPLAPQAPAPEPTPVVTASTLVTSPAPVTTLAADDGSPAYLATIDVHRGRVTVMPVPAAAADSEGRVPELWLIREGEAARSLGVIDTATAYEIQVPTELLPGLVAGSLLAVTLEPPGGAPQGVATGPITAKGAIERI